MSILEGIGPEKGEVREGEGLTYNGKVNVHKNCHIEVLVTIARQWIKRGQAVLIHHKALF